MLEKMDYTGKTKSIYRCDRCNKRINTSSEKRFKVGIDTYMNRTSTIKILKRYDLCKKCVSEIVRFVEKGNK